MVNFEASTNPNKREERNRAISPTRHQKGLSEHGQFVELLTWTAFNNTYSYVNQNPMYSNNEQIITRSN